MNILSSVKNTCNVPIEDTTFDIELLSLSSAAIFNAVQSGIGTKIIQVTKDTTWDEFIDVNKYPAVIPYICYSIKKIFDPTTSFTIKEAYDYMIAQYAHHLKVSFTNDLESVGKE